MRSSSLARVVMASLGLSVVITLGCNNPPPGGPSKLPSPTVTVEFGGRVLNADVGGPVANVRVSLDVLGTRGITSGANAQQIATSGGDGTFTLPLNLPSDWTGVSLKFTGPAGYDDTEGRYMAPAAPCWFSPCWTAADRPAIRMYPTIVVRPGESIEVRVDSGIKLCGSAFEDLADCRRVLVAASPGAPVELEIVPDDNSKPMALTLRPEDWFLNDPNVSVHRLMVPAGGVLYVLGTGTARLTAHR